MTKKRRKKAPRKGKSAIWGGRFESGPADVMEAINASIDFDRRLYVQDIAGSRAHCAMLMDKGIISPKDGNAILAGLDRIQAEIEGGGFRFERALEDIHMNIEARLARLVGPAAGRLHTARSRNDQVATDLRLWVRETLDSLDLRLARLQAALIEHAERHAATVMPGFTHSQAAQPVTLGHHLLAYVEMFGRDRGRVADCRRRANECPLGAVALAGTVFPIDRRASARALGFARPSANSIDAVSDRDFVLEFLSAGAILAVHLSRLGEEIVLWCSDGFRFVRLSDAYTTGSSVMPQKRNPDAAELVRAKAGRIIGALTGLLVVLKALPLAYGKDLQEDKEPAFDAADSLALSLDAMTGMIEDAAFDAEAMRAAAAKGYATATDLADWLVRELNMPFRKAHEAAGRMVRRAEGRGCALEDLPLAEMRAIVPEIEDGVFAVLGVENSVKSRTSFGGTAPANVRRAVRAARKRFLRT